jgi:hypothetical protein
MQMSSSQAQSLTLQFLQVKEHTLWAIMDIFPDPDISACIGITLANPAHLTLLEGGVECLQNIHHNPGQPAVFIIQVQDKAYNRSLFMP